MPNKPIQSRPDLTPDPERVSDKNGPEKQGARARLLLNLIKNGTIPAQPDHFVDELRKMAATDQTELQPDPENMLTALAHHFRKRNDVIEQHTPERAVTQASQNPDVAGSQREDSIKPDARMDLEPNAEPESLQDQHPAVICQQFENLSERDIKERIRNLPGQTARHVTFLFWQKS